MRAPALNFLQGGIVEAGRRVLEGAELCLEGALPQFKGRKEAPRGVRRGPTPPPPGGATIGREQCITLTHIVQLERLPNLAKFFQNINFLFSSFFPEILEEIDTCVAENTFC